MLVCRLCSSRKSVRNERTSQWRIRKEKKESMTKLITWTSLVRRNLLAARIERRKSFLDRNKSNSRGHSLFSNIRVSSFEESNCKEVKSNGQFGLERSKPHQRKWKTSNKRRTQHVFGFIWEYIEKSICNRFIFGDWIVFFWASFGSNHSSNIWANWMFYSWSFKD